MNEPIFELSNVEYIYPGGVRALRGIDLTVMPGESIAIMGTNGSGKSTLLKIMDGLYFPSKGVIKALGAELSERQFQEESFAFAFRKKVGLLFQDPDVQLFSTTVLDEVAFAPLNMGMDREEAMIRVYSALDALGIENIKDRAPYMLSEGEKKKVAMASLLSLDPDVWLLDEPTANLDPRTQDWMIKFLLSLAEKGKTLVIAIHDLDVAESVAGKIYVLGENHKIVAQGTSHEILGYKDILVQNNLLGQRRYRV